MRFLFIGRGGQGPLGVCALWRHRAPRVSRCGGDAITLLFQTMLRKKPRWRSRLKWRPKFSARLTQESSHRRPASLLPIVPVLREEMSSPPKEKLETKGGHAPAGKRSSAPSALFLEILRTNSTTRGIITWRLSRTQAITAFSWHGASASACISVFPASFPRLWTRKGCRNELTTRVLEVFSGRVLVCATLTWT